MIGKRWGIVFSVLMAAALCALAPSLAVVAAGASGFPSRPRFQSVGINTTPPATAGDFSISGSMTGGTVPDARLTSNVPLKNASNTFTGSAQEIGNAGGTGTQWWRATSLGGDAIFGLASSAGGGVFSGASAYAAVMGSYANRPTQVIANGAVVGTFTPSGGLQMGAPTGGDKGAGTLNTAGTIYTNNVPVPAMRIAAALCDSGTGGSTCTQSVGSGATIAWASNGGAGVGNFTLTGFTATPTCTASPAFTAGASRTARINIQSSTAVTTVTETSTTGAAVNSQVTVICVGV